MRCCSSKYSKRRKGKPAPLTHQNMPTPHSNSSSPFRIDARHRHPGVVEHSRRLKPTQISIASGKTVLATSYDTNANVLAQSWSTRCNNASQNNLFSGKNVTWYTPRPWTDHDHRVANLFGNIKALHSSSIIVIDRQQHDFFTACPLPPSITINQNCASKQRQPTR